MKKVINRLIEILKMESLLYEKLLKLSHHEQNLLITGNVAELENKVKEKEELIYKVKEIDRERQEVMEEISLKLNVNVKELNVSKLQKMVSEPLTSQLKSAQERILNLIAQLSEVNETNTELIRNSLEYIDFTLNLLTTHPQIPTYGKKGESGEKSNDSLFYDNKV